MSPASKLPEKSNKLESTKTKWNQWSPLSALTTKNEKRKTLDDSALEVRIFSKFSFVMQVVF